MKKTFLTMLLTAVLLCVSQAVSAQFKFGLRVGTNLSRMQTNVLNSDNRGGFFVGGVLEAKIRAIPFGFDLAAIYDLRHVKAINPVTGCPMNSNMQFASVPFNLRCPIGIGKVLQVAAYTGPQCDFALGSKNIFSKNYRMRDATWSWNIGASLRILKHYQLGYTYNIGMTHVAKLVPDADFVSTGSLRNNTHQIHVSYFF